MRNFTKVLIVVVCLLQFNYSKSQSSNIFADTVYSFSSEFHVSPGSWSSSKIIGAPDVYPSCNDNYNAWSFSGVNNGDSIHPREWIEIGYSTHYYVDSINVYETYRSGLIDTIYFRDAVSGMWNIVYTNTAVYSSACNVLRIGMIQTPYTVDAVRLAMDNHYPAYAYPEYDAVELVGDITNNVNMHTINNSVVLDNSNPKLISIISKLDKIKNISLCNVLGKQVLIKAINNYNFYYETNNLVNGVYFITINLDNGKSVSFKTIVNN